LNSKLLLIILCAISSGCGVKAKPISPPETAVSSYVESFTGAPFEKEKETPQKNNPAK